MHLSLVLAFVALSSGAVAAATESDGEDVAASVTARQARALRGRERWRNSTHFGASACALAHAPLLHIGSHVPQDDVPASESDGEDEPGMDRHRVRLQRVNLPQPRLRTLAGASTVGAAAGCGAGSCAVLGMTHVRLVGPSHGMTSPPTLLRVRGGFGPRWPFKRDEEEDGEAEERGRDKKAKDKEQRKRKDDDDETVSEDSHKEKGNVIRRDQSETGTGGTGWEPLRGARHTVKRAPTQSGTQRIERIVQKALLELRLGFCPQGLLHLIPQCCTRSGRCSAPANGIRRRGSLRALHHGSGVCCASALPLRLCSRWL